MSLFKAFLFLREKSHNVYHSKITVYEVHFRKNKAFYIYSCLIPNRIVCDAHRFYGAPYHCYHIFGVECV